MNGEFTKGFPMGPVAVVLLGLTVALALVRLALRLSLTMQQGLTPVRARPQPRPGAIPTLRRDPDTGVYRPD